MKNTGNLKISRVLKRALREVVAGTCGHPIWSVQSLMESI